MFKYIVVAVFALFFFVDALVPGIAIESIPDLNDLPDVAAERLVLVAPAEEILVAEDVALEGPARRKRALDAALDLISGVISGVAP